MARGKVKPDEFCKLQAVRVRMTETERAALDDLACSAGLTVSEFVRHTLDLPSMQRRMLTAQFEEVQRQKSAIDQKVSELTAKLAALGVVPAS